MPSHSSASEKPGQGFSFRSNSENQGVTIDPNIAWRRSVALAEEGQLESGSDGEFEDSRDNLAPVNQIEPPTSLPDTFQVPAEVAAPPQCQILHFISMGGPIPSGEVDINQVGMGH